MSEGFVASDVLEKIDSFNLSKFPDKIAYPNDIIIKIGHIIFSIRFT